MKNNLVFIGICFTVILFSVVSNALALPVMYEALPTANSGYRSFHSNKGPVLADDFVTAISGTVGSVEWWGAATGTMESTWEITFHNSIFDNTNNEWEPSSPYVSQHFVNALGTDTDGDGVFHYVAEWNPYDVVLTAGTSYWFSVASCHLEVWTWALSSNLGGFATPTVGSESYGAMWSEGDAGEGPHDGPWTQLSGRPDLAFKINATPEVVAIPEPATMLLFGTGLAAYAALRRRKSDALDVIKFA